MELQIGGPLGGHRLDRASAIIYQEPVLPGLRRWLVVISLVLCIGGHWAILQSAAWAGMLLKNSHRASLRQAISDTFDGQHPCKLCKIVRAGKAAEQKQNGLELKEKSLEFTCHASVAFVFPPGPHQRPTAFQPTGFAREKSPSLPPPKAA